MKHEIKIPSMGESIAEATIGQILAPTGTIVKADAEILEMETDKVNQVLYAPQAGRVLLTVKPGDTVKIGQVIGSLESVDMALSNAVKGETPSSPAAPSIVNTKIGIEARPAQSEKAVHIGKEIFIAELDAASKPVKKVEVRVEMPAPANETRRPMSRIRKVIAQRLVEAQHTMAMLTTFNEVDMTHVIELREKYKEAFIKTYQCKLGFMSFFVKATVSALQANPALNSYIDGEDIVHRETYDIGVAVGTDKGVIVPVICNCDKLTYAQIEQALETFAKKAREGKLIASDLQGGGFTITNGGVYGSLLSTPILLPPQCGILGMHKIEKRPVAVDDQIVIRSMMYLALSYDHRLIDGKEAVSFLVHIKNMLEDPSRLLLEI